MTCRWWTHTISTLLRAKDNTKNTKLRTHSLKRVIYEPGSMTTSWTLIAKYYNENSLKTTRKSLLSEIV